ncbi:hypothetical protein CLIB1444_04S09934 [[Candida] jaroonii]|uniref:Uncharacterized protein n=1 Tax=[Candida] jaroonii TaxID=467808 RepID=A0ACA9Y835_9ASCO|nr:hypothetical protein CLIB1444_04S09934 [[Candida] jaroonii]
MSQVIMSHNFMDASQSNNPKDEELSFVDMTTPSLNSPNNYTDFIADSVSINSRSKLISTTPNIQGDQAVSITHTGKRPKHTRRSRNGCISCKKLRIKCNEMVPKCEYCTSTNRECVYYITSQRKFLEKPNNRYTNKLIKSLEDREQSPTEISNFEVKILKHFKIYTLQFTSFINGPMHYLTTVDIPNLFESSHVVRSAVYAFGCLNSWVICDLPNPKPGKSLIFKNQLRNPFHFSDSIQRKLFDTNLNFLDDFKGLPNLQLGLKCSQYKSFLYSSRTLYSVTNIYLIRLIDELNEELSTGQLSSERGKALVIGVMMVLLFLALHSHNTTPLMKFDDKFQYCYGKQVEGKHLDLDTDILTICSVIRTKTTYVFSSLGDSEVSTLLAMRAVDTTQDFYLINKLQSQLEESRNQFTSREVDILNSNLNHLKQGFSRCYELDSPIGLFKLLTRFCDDFLDLARNKNLFALRILFIYSFVMLELRTCLFVNKNVWLDYMEWFRSYNSTKYGKWAHAFDFTIYNLIGKLDVESTRELLDKDLEH